MESAIFWPAPPKFSNIFSAGHPFPNTQLGRWGIRNYRRQKTNRVTPRSAKERDGSLKFSQPALDSHICCGPPPSMSQYFRRRTPPSPTPEWREMGNTKLPHAKTKTKTAEPRGTLRSATDRLNLANSPWSPPYFGGPLPNFPIFLAPGAPSPTPNWGRRVIRNYRRKKTHRGTPRNATERDGALKFGHPELESGEFWPIPP